MPKYMKFMKSILSKKKKLEEFENIALTEEVSAVLQRKLPPKLKDPGSFVIPCSIGSIDSKALCDLGASVNLMPYSLYKILGLGEVKPTTITLQLADRSVIFPRGIVENILVKVKNLILPADFIVLDIEEGGEVPLIIGRPFLATGRTIIDVEGGELIMRVFDETVVIKVFDKSDYLEDIMMCLEEDQCEDFKCASCFALMNAKKKRKRQKSRLKLTNLSNSSSDGEAHDNFHSSSPELPCSAHSSLNTFTSLDLSTGRRYKMNRKEMHD